MYNVTNDKTVNKIEEINKKLIEFSTESPNENKAMEYLYTVAQIMNDYEQLEEITENAEEYQKQINKDKKI